MKICSIENCGRKYHAKNLCFNHYLLWRYHNTPRIMKKTGTKYSRRYGMKIRDIANNMGVSEDLIYRLAKKDQIPEYHLTNLKIDSTVTIEPAETQTTEKVPVNQPGGPR